MSTVADGAEEIEWRHGWYWSGRVYLRWREWGLGFNLGFHWRRDVGGDFQLGPIGGYFGWEEEDRMFKNGVDMGCAVAPVDGYTGTP